MKVKGEILIDVDVTKEPSILDTLEYSDEWEKVGAWAGLDGSGYTFKKVLNYETEASDIVCDKSTLQPLVSALTHKAK